MGGRGASSGGAGGGLGNSAQKTKVQQMIENVERMGTVKSIKFSKTNDGQVAYSYSYNGRVVNGAIDTNGTAYRTDDYVNNKNWKIHENKNYHAARKDVTSSTYEKAQKALQKQVNSWFGKR